MHKRIGLVVVAMMLVAGILPFLAVAEPTRTLSAKIVDVMLDGVMGPEDEYASGIHEVTYLVNNTGDEYFTDLTSVYLKVFYPNDTLFLSSSDDNIVIIVDNETSRQGSFVFGDISLPEGEFKIVVNATLKGINTSAFIDVTIMDVVDLSIDSDFFEPEGTYPLDEEMMPTCSVEYDGNVEEWAGDVTVNLNITHTDPDIPVVYYDEDMVIMLHNSTPVNPGHIFSVMFDQGWIPVISGAYRAVFTVDIEDYDQENDMFTVYFSVEQRPSIEGYTKTTAGTPVQGVNVRAIIGTFDTEVLTDSDGYYQFMNLASGTYSLEFTKLWSTSALNNSVVVADGTTTTVNAVINKMAVGGLEGQVFLPDDVTPAEGATITITIPGEPPSTEIADQDGNYSFSSVKAGQISLVASLDGYENDERSSFTIIEQIWNPLDLTLGDIPFTVDISPPSGDTSISISPTVSLQFSKAINKTTVNQTTIYMVKLSTSESISVSFAFIDEENTVLVEPQNLLDYNTDYRITITDLLEDTNGNTFPQITYSTFTTEVEIIEIDITSRYPGDDQNEVPIGASITATFPEPMVASTISEDTFQVFISGGGGTPISGTVVYYSNNYTAMFIPASNFQYEGRYSVSLSDQMTPVDSTHIFRGTTWSFETMALITTGTVKGFVKDKDGEPFSPDKVKITIQKGSSEPISLNVNMDGKFNKADLPAGIWTIKIEIPDHEKYSDVFTIIAGEDTDLKDIKIEKKEENSDLMTIGTIVLVILVIVVIIILLYVFILGRREKPEEEEETGRARRPAPFSAGRQRESFHDSGFYDEIAEGEFMCPVCGNVVGADEPDCANCGAEFEDDLFECPECGSLLQGDAMDCPDCGAKFEEELQESEEVYDDEVEEPDITEGYEVEDMDEEEIPFRDRE